MVVEFISCPITKICDQAGSHTYYPDVEVRFKKQTQYRVRSFTGQLHNDGMPFISYM